MSPPRVGKIAALKGVAFRISPEEERPIEGEGDGLFLLVPLSLHFLGRLARPRVRGENPGKAGWLDADKKIAAREDFFATLWNLR